MWEGGTRTQYWNVLSCNPGTYCCRVAGATADCCNDTNAIRSFSVVPGFSAPKTVTSVKTVSTTTGVTATAQPQPSSDGSSCTNNTLASSQASCTSNGKVVAVGAGVGVPLGTLLAIALAGLVFFRRKQQKLQRQLDNYQGVSPSRTSERDVKNPGLVSSTQGLHEAASTPVAEMNAVR